MKKFLFGILGLLFAVPAVAATLPAGYTELEYIEFTGTQYVDTGFIPNQNAEIRTKFYPTDYKRWVYGTGNANPRISSYIAQQNSTGNQRWGFATYSTGPFVNTMCTVVHNKNGWMLNGELHAYDNVTDFTALNSLSIGVGTGDTTDAPFQGKMYYFQIYDNGNLVRNFVPAKNSSGVVGMYDTVSGNFFTNAGTGTFTGGNELDSCRNLANITENTITLGMYTASDGTVVTTDNFSFQSDFIPVSPNTTYTISANEGMTMIRVVEYDAGGNFIRRNATATSSNASKLTFTTGANTAKVTIGANQSVNNLTAAQVLAANWQLELGSTATEYVPYCANAIKIATTAYNSARFSPVVTELNDTIATIRSVVTNTINQTKAIADLQATKQTRPDEQCPAGKKCLLVEDNDGQPHWYEIIENAYGLPSGYTALEYIQSTGTQYIELDIPMYSNYTYKTVYEYTNKATGALFGASDTTAFHTGSIIAHTYSGNALAIYAKQGEGAASGGMGPVNNNEVYTAIWTPKTGVININGTDFSAVSQSFTNADFATSYKECLFALNAPAVRAYTNGERIYSHQVYNGSVLLVDLVPAKNSSNVIGMYDTVSGRFFTNKGTGTFVEGSEI